MASRNMRLHLDITVHDDGTQQQLCDMVGNGVNLASGLAALMDVSPIVRAIVQRAVDLHKLGYKATDVKHVPQNLEGGAGC